MDPDLDLDPAIFVSDLRDINKILFFLLLFEGRVHLHQFSKIKSHKTVGIMLFLLFLLDDRRIRIHKSY